MTMNPVSAITGATGDRILPIRWCAVLFCRHARAAAIGARIGCPIHQPPENGTR